jgi:hypothetical protein
MRKADWASTADVKRQFGAGVDFVGDNRLIFDLGGNKYRLVIHVSYTCKRILVKFIGTMPNTTKSMRRSCDADPSSSDARDRDHGDGMEAEPRMGNPC